MLRFWFLCILFFIISTCSWAADSKSFWVWDLTVMPPGFRKPVFQQIKNSNQFWLEENINLSPLAAEKLTSAFQKIDQVLNPLFGPLPLENRNEDSTAQILLAALPPYVNKQGKSFGFDGFFNVFDQLSEADAQKENQHSNEANIIYLNALQPLDSNYMLGVLAHEYTHLLTYGKQGSLLSLDPWMNELLGEAGMQLAGYYSDRGHVLKYLENLSSPVAINNYSLHYGALSLFAEFLLQKNGPQSLSRLSIEGGKGLDAFSLIYSKNFFSLFSEYVTWLFTSDQAELTSKFDLKDKIKPKTSDLPVKIFPTGVVFLKNEITPVQVHISPVLPVKDECAAMGANLRTKYFEKLKATAVWLEGKLGCPFEIK